MASVSPGSLYAKPTADFFRCQELNLTEPQHRAATTLDRPVVVTAGPGSGKTRVLVARYLAILESTPADIENIVAITFTKKAASEMRDRVRKEMDRRASAAGDPATRLAWRQRRRKLDAAVITTIHGFCSRLLREHPVEAATDPQFSVLDAYQESVMTDAAAHAAVTRAIDEGVTEVAELVASYSRLGLVRAIERVLKTTRSLGLELDELIESSERQLGTLEAWNDNVARVHSLLGDAMGTLSVLPDRPKASRDSKLNATNQLQAFSAAWAALLRHSGQTGSAVFDAGTFALLARLGATLPNRNLATRLRPFVAELHDLVGKSGLNGKLGGSALDVVARRYLPVFAGLVQKMGDVYSAEKRSASALDFEDLQLGVRRLLSNHPDVARRARARYRYFLVDEFQDTNGLQKEIVSAFVDGPGAANLFIVGDPKQSIYGFRGAEVSVFAETSRAIQAASGERVALSTNFRSDGRIVTFVREFFDRVMRPPGGLEESELEALGFVAHDGSLADHEPESDEPVVELILATEWPTETDALESESAASSESAGESEEEEVDRDLEARMLAERIRDLVRSGEPVVRVRVQGRTVARRACCYGDIALLLRTRSHGKDYERALRRAGVPFYVVAGRGFYDRAETRDLLEVLRFLDNSTDELALAATLRSPLFGVSDETLLGLRADRLAVAQATGRRPRSADDRPLWKAVVDHRRATLVSGEQQEVLGRAVEVLQALRAMRNQMPISALLRELIRRTQIDAVVAASDDGEQRLSNIEKLISIARSFERGSGRLLGDFTEYVREFNRLETDEAEANVRANANAVAIMTVHQSKGLEFPVVAIADLQGEFRSGGDDVLLDRKLGIGFKVPDGTARRLPTLLHSRLVERLRVRERFESMRTLYVAATRAEDRLILSAAVRSLKVDDRGVPLIDESREAVDDRSWLTWLLRAVAESGGRFDLESGEVFLGESRLRLIRRLESTPDVLEEDGTAISGGEDAPDAPSSLHPEPEAVAARVERLMAPLSPSKVPASTRFAVTSLLGFSTCARRFLFGRLLKFPELSDVARVRDVSEAPEPGSSIPASLRGLIVHRFCETLLPGETVGDRLPVAVADVRRERGEAYADVFAIADDDDIAGEIQPLAENYSRSALRSRIDALTRADADTLAVSAASPGLPGFAVSEMGFSLRFDEGSVVGAIDKLLLAPDGDAGWRAEVVDFKTNRIANGERRTEALAELERSYRLQMQAYSLAVRRLVPKVLSVSASLVALAAGPDVTSETASADLEETAAHESIRLVLERIRDAGTEPANFPARPGRHCQSCAHVAICPEGSASLR